MYQWVRVISFTVVYLNVVKAQQVNTSITYVHDDVIENTAVLQCNWTCRETSPTFLIETSPQIALFICMMVSRTVSCSKTPTSSDRYSLNYTRLGSFSMTIRNLHCSEERVYTCSMICDKEIKSSNSTLNLKVPPTPPELTGVKVSVVENENITATCTAILGYPKPRDIVWKTFKNRQLVDLSSKLSVTTVSVYQPGDDNCTIRKQSTANLKAEKDYQDLILACFLLDKELQSSVPDFCENQTKDLCSQTEPVNIVQNAYTIAQVSTNYTVSVSTTVPPLLIFQQSNASKIQQDCELVRKKCRFHCLEPDCSDFLLVLVVAILSVIMISLLVVIIFLMKRMKEIALAESNEEKPVELNVPDNEVHTPV